MTENREELEHSTNEEPAKEFLDCLAYLLARRWLAEQRAADGVSMRGPEEPQSQDEHLSFTA